MKKSLKRILLVLSVVSAFCIAGAVAACTEGGEASSHIHSMETVSAVAATCVEDGNIKYYHCTGCGNNYSDSQGENELTSEDIVVKATGVHTQPKTYSYDEASHWYECTVCGGTFDVSDHTFGTDGACSTCGVTVISTADELKAISMSGTFVLSADIDLGGTTWTPIGTADSAFSGVFDGGNHTISNYVISDSSLAYLGLFGYSSGNIQNLTVNDFTITVNISSSSPSKNYIGGLAGYSSDIINCSAMGEIAVSGNDAGGHLYVGGLTGYAYRSNIEDSNSSVKVNISSLSGSSDLMMYTGGLIGFINDSDVTGCYSTGEVNASVTSNVVYSYVGGMAGYILESAVAECFITGNVTAITKSTSTKTSAFSGGYVGGLCGYSSSSTVTRVYNTGDVSGTVTTVQYGDSDVGGLCGVYSGRTMSDCYSTGNVISYMSASTVKSDYYPNNSTGYSCAGGLVGYIYSSNASTVTTSYATGNVSATGIKAAAYAGGIAGKNYGLVTYSFATCEVTASVDNSTENIYAFAGGVTGNDDEGSLSTTYRLSGQTVTGGVIGLAGNEATLDQLQSKTFLTETVGFSSDVWSFTYGTYPVQIVYSDSYTPNTDSGSGSGSDSVSGESGGNTSDISDGEAEGSEGLIYTLVSDHYVVSGIGTCTAQSVVISSTYNRLPVTAIVDEAFYGNSTMMSVTIPSSVTSIGVGAFDSCSKLTSVSLVSGLTSLGSDAFSGCISLTSIVLPDTLTEISDSAFAGCLKLASVTLPSGATSIGQSAFEGCIKLSSVTIPASVTLIKVNAFYGCTALKSVTFSDTNNWYLANYATAANGTSVDVTSASANAENLSGEEYAIYYWIKKVG